MLWSSRAGNLVHIYAYNESLSEEATLNDRG